MEHDDDHERLLAELLTGVEDARSPRASALLEDCDLCRLRWRELRRLQARLDAGLVWSDPDSEASGPPDSAGKPPMR